MPMPMHMLMPGHRRSHATTIIMVVFRVWCVECVVRCAVVVSDADKINVN